MGHGLCRRAGEDFEMANRIVAEGDASRADVFVTENSPAMSLVPAEADLPVSPSPDPPDRLEDERRRLTAAVTSLERGGPP